MAMPCISIVSDTSFQLLKQVTENHETLYEHVLLGDTVLNIALHIAVYVLSK
jgi:hypothetical protein